MLTAVDTIRMRIMIQSVMGLVESKNVVVASAFVPESWVVVVSALPLKSMRVSAVGEVGLAPDTALVSSTASKRPNTRFVFLFIVILNV
jgi:hypothetical protein